MTKFSRTSYQLVGFTAAVRTASGEISKVRSFDQTAEEKVAGSWAPAQQQAL
jgi:hypothetical protein